MNDGVTARSSRPRPARFARYSARSARRSEGVGALDAVPFGDAAGAGLTERRRTRHAREHRVRMRRIAAREQDGELVAADAREPVAGAKLGQPCPCCRGEERVARPRVHAGR